MDDRADAAALVEVGAAEEHEQVPVPGAHGAHLAGVPGDRRRGEAGQVGGGDLGDHVAEPVDGGEPPRAEHEGDVVALDAGEIAEDGGSLGGRGGGFGGLAHAGHSTAPTAVPEPRRTDPLEPRVRVRLALPL